MTVREALEKARGNLGIVGWCTTILVIAWGAHVWTITSIARQTGVEMAAACVAAISAHQADPLAHPSMRVMYPTQREHDREQMVVNQLALSIEEIKREAREEVQRRGERDVKLVATQNELLVKITRLEVMTGARGR